MSEEQLKIREDEAGSKRITAEDLEKLGGKVLKVGLKFIRYEFNKLCSVLLAKGKEGLEGRKKKGK